MGATINKFHAKANFVHCQIQFIFSTTYFASYSVFCFLPSIFFLPRKQSWDFIKILIFIFYQAILMHHKPYYSVIVPHLQQK